MTEEYSKLWHNQAFLATLLKHWRTYECNNYGKIYKQKASELNQDSLEEDTEQEDEEDEIDILGYSMHSVDAESNDSPEDAIGGIDLSKNLGVSFM